jgi:tetratricopeptide (TPR) repeat protein
MRRGTLTWVVLVGAAVLLAGCKSAKPEAGVVAIPTVDPKDPLAAMTLLHQGKALIGEGRVDEGIARYRAALQLQPTNPTIHNAIGAAELQRDNATKALESFNRALQYAPAYSDARNNRGAAYVRLNQLALAENDFLEVLADNTYANRTGVYFNLGSLYLGRGNLAAAEENLRKAARPSGPVDAYALLAEVLHRQGKTALAESTLREGLNRAPERADLALALAELLLQEGRADEAQEMFHRVITLAPQSQEADTARKRLGS